MTMELNEIKKIWRRQQKSEEVACSKKELKAIVNNKMRSLEEEIKRRDRIEIVACGIIIAIFGVILFTTTSIWTQMGCVTVVSSACYICYKLKAAQFVEIKEEQSPDRPVRLHLKQELEQVEKQKKLLKNIAWWYIIPLTVGLLLITIGGQSTLFYKVTYMAAVILFGIFVWYLNQKTVRKKFDTLEKEIKKAIAFIEKGNTEQ